MANTPGILPYFRKTASTFWRWYRANWHQPAMVLPYMIIFTQVVKEFYPFSHFPMYSNPSAMETRVIFVIDAEKRAENGELIPVSMEPMFGVRAARAKKIFHTRLDDYGKKLDPKLKRDELNPEQVAEVARELLAYLRDRAKAIRTMDQLPTKLALAQKTIAAELGVGFRLDESIIAHEL